jgi:uncharacterized membrane protein
LFTLVFAGLSIKRPVDEFQQIFLIDESKSINSETREFILKFLQDSSNSNKKIKRSFISFARDPKLSEFAQQKLNDSQNDSQNQFQNQTQQNHATAIDSKTDSELYWSDETNIESAIKLAESLSNSSDFNCMITLISDGNETVGNSIAAAAHCKTPISTVPIPESKLPEISVSEFIVPAQLKSGEPFNIDLTIYSNQSTETDIFIFRNEFKIHSATKQLSAGENKFRFQQIASDDRLQTFRVNIESVNDTVQENNISRKISVVETPPHILIIDSSPEILADFVSALSEHGFKIETRPIEGIPKTSDKFMQFDAIIISDVPASAFSLQQMNLLRDYVYTFGGGLIMLGGERSFGQGGYYKTVVEDILPVRCNFDDEKEKSSIALALVIDRSGSMSGEKIKIAKESAKVAVDLLSPNDFISIIAYDAIPHVIVPTQKASSQTTIRSAINGIVSGGGTNIYAALQESYEQLDWLNTTSKHVILLTDGKNESDDFESLMKRFAAARITVTIISVGDSKDDELLRQIADLGNGRYYRAEDLKSVPQIFVSETMLSGKSAISEIPFVPIIVTKNTVLDGITLDQIPPLLGFVKTKSKTTSKIILATETGEPLLSWRRYGIGIAAAFTSDVKNQWAAEWLIWNDFSKLWSQIIRFVIKQQKSDNAVIECKFVNEKIEVEIDITDSEDRFINEATGILTIVTPDLLKQKIPFDQIAAGRYKAIFNINRTKTSRGIYQLQMQLQTKEQQTILQHARAIIIDNSKELQKKNVNVKLLKKIAELSGGKFNPTPSETLQLPNKPVLKNISLRSQLFVTIILLFLLDVFLKRKK